MMAECADSNITPQSSRADGQGRIEEQRTTPQQAPEPRTAPQLPVPQQPANWTAGHATEQRTEGPGPQGASASAHAAKDAAAGSSNPPPGPATPPTSAPSNGQPSLPDAAGEALAMMVQAGADEAKSKAALATVSRGGMDIEGWAFAAIEYLTAQSDLEVEAAELHAAMQRSLSEAEALASEAVPLEEHTPEQIDERFKASRLLPKLRSTCCGEQLFVPPLLEALLGLLELERQSCKWYPTGGTRAYFEALACECVDAVAAPVEDDSSQPPSPPAAAAAEEDTQKPAKRRRRASVRLKESLEEAGKKAPLPPPAVKEEPPLQAPLQPNTAAQEAARQAALLTFLQDKATALEQCLYQMPELSGQLPAIFAGLEGQDEEPDPEELTMLPEQGNDAAAQKQEPEPELVE